MQLFGDHFIGIYPKRVQILRRKIWTKIRAMSPDCAVLHQAVFQEDCLSRADVVACEDCRPISINDLIGNRRRIAIRTDRHPNQDREADDHGNQRNGLVVFQPAPIEANSKHGNRDH